MVCLATPTECHCAGISNIPPKKERDDACAWIELCPMFPFITQSVTDTFAEVVATTASLISVNLQRVTHEFTAFLNSMNFQPPS